MLITIHKWIMIISWGILLPFSIFIVYSLKHTTNHVKFIHKVIQYIRCIINIIGIAFILQYKHIHFETTHGKLGISITILSLCQVCIATCRPRNDFSIQRYIWVTFHLLVGFILLIGGYINIYIKLKWSYLFVVLLTIVLTLFISQFILNKIKLHYEHIYTYIPATVH